MAAVPISCQPAEAHSRSDEPAASSASASSTARRPPRRACTAGPAKATSPISSMGTSVSSDMRLRSRPVCAPISAASGPMPAMKGRRFSATRAMAASNRPAGAGFPARFLHESSLHACRWMACCHCAYSPARPAPAPARAGSAWTALRRAWPDRRRPPPWTARRARRRRSNRRRPPRGCPPAASPPCTWGGMAAGIDRAAAQVRRAKLAAGAHGHQLGMRGGVVRGQDFIDAGGQHLAVAHQHRAEGTLAGGDVGAGQLDGHVQEMQGIAHVSAPGSRGDGQAASAPSSVLWSVLTIASGSNI